MSESTRSDARAKAAAGGPVVVHILIPSACGDEGLVCCAAALARMDGCAHMVIIVGNSDAEQRAWAMGIESVDRVPMCASMHLTVRRVRSVLDARLAGRPAESTLLQAWSASGLMLAARVRQDIPRVGVICRSPDLAGADIRHALDGATLCAMDCRVRSELGVASAGDRSLVAAMARVRLIEPPVAGTAEGDAPWRVHLDRERVRARLGLGPADVVVGLLADPPEMGDARRVCFAIGLDHVLGANAVALVRRGSRQTRRAARFNRLNARRWDMLIADISLTQLIAASDVCVIDTDREVGGSPSCGPTGVAMALCGGVPVAGSALGTPLLDGPHAMPVEQPSGSRTGAGGLATPIERLLRDESVRVRHAHEARAWLDRARARDGFASTLAGVWAETLRVPVLAGASSIPAA